MREYNFERTCRFLRMLTLSGVLQRPILKIIFYWKFKAVTVEAIAVSVAVEAVETMSLVFYYDDYVADYLVRVWPTL